MRRGQLTPPAHSPCRPFFRDDETSLELPGPSSFTQFGIGFDLGLVHSGFLQGHLLHSNLLFFNFFLMLVLAAKRFHQLREALVALDEVLVFTLRRDSAILEGVDVVALRKEMQRMGDEDDGLTTVAERTEDSVCE